MLEISVRYSNERVAFEKKISKFQAVQQQSGAVSPAKVGAGIGRRDPSAADAIANSTAFNDEVFLEAASAKIRCSEAAEKWRRDRAPGPWRDRLHHRAHPAPLFLLRALAWRSDDFGSESYRAV